MKQNFHPSSSTLTIIFQTKRVLSRTDMHRGLRYLREKRCPPLVPAPETTALKKLGPQRCIDFPLSVSPTAPCLPSPAPLSHSGEGQWSSFRRKGRTKEELMTLMCTKNPQSLSLEELEQSLDRGPPPRSTATRKELQTYLSKFRILLLKKTESEEEDDDDSPREEDVKVSQKRGGTTKNVWERRKA